MKGAGDSCPPLLTPLHESVTCEVLQMRLYLALGFLVTYDVLRTSFQFLVCMWREILLLFSLVDGRPRLWTGVQGKFMAYTIVFRLSFRLNYWTYSTRKKYIRRSRCFACREGLRLLPCKFVFRGAALS